MLRESTVELVGVEIFSGVRVRARIRITSYTKAMWSDMIVVRSNWPELL